MAGQHHAEPDMAQFFDFTDADMSDVTQTIADFTSAPSPQIAAATCPIHPNEVYVAPCSKSFGSFSRGYRCFCPSLLDDFAQNPELDLLPDVSDAIDPTIRIPRFSRPSASCEYCRIMKLDCFFSYEAQKSCTSCTALFRPCSFVQQSANAQMATLHPVIEDQTIERGSQTGLIALKSWNYAAGMPRGGDDESRLPGRKTGIRFSRDNIKVLKAWMIEHRDHPYPTEEEKEALCQKTGLKPTQISNWLANTRRRTKQSVRSSSPSLPSWPNASEAINIRPNKQGITHKSKEWETMTPMDRWKISPPENEPAAIEDIAHAVTNTTLTPPDSASLQEVRRPRGVESSANSDSNSLWSNPIWKARSTASLDRSFSAVSSGSFSNASLGSAPSHNSSRNSFGSFGSKVSKDRRRRRRTAANPSKRVSADEGRRIFQCTFCTDTFKSKYDWSRHEKSLHLSLEKWICSPIGEVLTDTTTGIRKCVFCDEVNPSNAHLEQHNFRACEEKGLQARTFYRKDHLRQHLRLMHGCKMTASMEAWKSEATYIKCRCGFCGAEFNRWSDRVDHIAKHFRNGAHMKDWKGCRGFDPTVAAQVTNAMPPYLIANEAKSPFPFSATNESSIRQHAMQTAGPSQDLEAILPTASLAAYDMVEATNAAGQGPSRQGSLPSLTQSLQTPPSASMSGNSQIKNTYPFGRATVGSTTCWEILTVRLGRFVAEQMSKNPTEPVTDELLQREARIILYDDDDTWNQTAADNPEWLRLFKQAHGLAGKEQQANFSGADFAEDLGMGIGELTFDQFFEEQSGGLSGLSLAEEPQFPIGGAIDLPTTMSDFGLGALTSHAPGVGELAAMSMGMNYQELERMVKSSSAIEMMQPAVDLMDLQCLYPDCRNDPLENPQPTSSGF